MFTRICVFLLLGSSLVLATPVRDNTRNELEINDIKTRSVIRDVFKSVTSPIKKIVQLMVETGEGVMDYGKEKVDQLVVKYYEIKDKSEQNLNDIKNRFIIRVVGQLQNVIDVLSEQADDQTLDNLKQKTQEIAESSKDALEKLQLQFQEAIEEEKKKLEENFVKWKQQADEAAKKT